MHKILQISLSAALISVRLAGGANAAYTEGDIVRMEELIDAQNWVELRAYLLANPSLLLGDDAFVQELRRFLENTDSLYTALTFDQSMFPNLGLRDVPQSVPTVPQAGTAPTEPGLVAGLPATANTQPRSQTPAIAPRSNQTTRSITTPSNAAASSIY